MKRIWLAAAAGAALLAGPAPAQQAAQEDPVKAGVDAWERGDHAAAVERWRRPAAQGNADAQFNLGQAFKTGRGVAQDLNQAEEWYRRAALQGHEQAENNYGLALFDNGKQAEAVDWLRKGVARGDARAQYVYGIMLFNGDFVDKQWPQAYALIVRASESGLDVASKARAQMDQYIPLAQRREGLALARTYAEQAGRGALPVAEPAARPAAAPARAATTRPAAPAPSRPATTAPASAAQDGGWRVQLGAFGEAGNANRLWARMESRFPGRRAYYVRAGKLTKLLVGPYASRQEAAAACRGVSPCVPTR